MLYFFDNPPYVPEYPDFDMCLPDYIQHFLFIFFLTPHPIKSSQVLEKHNFEKAHLMQRR